MYWWKRISDLRIDNDFTKQELAEKLDISERTLSRYETGETEPTIGVLIKMSLLFNVSIDYICCIKDDPTITEESTIDEISILVSKLQNIISKLK